MATIAGTRGAGTTAVGPYRAREPESCVPTGRVVRLDRAGNPLGHQVLRFAVVGLLGTATSALLYLLFRTWWEAVPANLAAVALSTVLSTEVNRRFTFHGAAADHTREYVQNAGSALFYAVYSSAVLVVLGRLVDDPTVVQESVAVAAASVVGGAARFLVLRNWVFDGGHATA
jgi:putative flippase GtrA